jgi:acyl-CoA thioesterase
MVLFRLWNPLKPDVNVMLTLSHSIHVYEPDGWSCADWFWIEDECPWSSQDGKHFVDVRLHTTKGNLVAVARPEVCESVSFVQRVWIGKV